MILYSPLKALPKIKALLDVFHLSKSCMLNYGTGKCILLVSLFRTRKVATYLTICFPESQKDSDKEE